MKLTKYASQSCVRCKLLDRVLQHLNIPEVETIYLEDVGVDFLKEKGVQSFPTLIIENNGKQKVLTGSFLPQDIVDAMNELT